MRFTRFNCFGSRNRKAKLVLLESRYNETQQGMEDLRLSKSELLKKIRELEGKLREREAENAELRRQNDAYKRKEIIFSENTIVSAQEEKWLNEPSDAAKLNEPATYDNPAERNESAVEDLHWTVRKLVKDGNGALIVLQAQDDKSINDWASLAVILNRPLDKRSLRGLFDKKSHLHDGGAIIRFADKPMLFAASVFASIEPDTPTTREHVYGKGSRHRAAREFSARSKTSILVIVVSEQNHAVSIAQGGNLREVSLDDLKTSIRDWLNLNWRSNAFRTGEATYAFSALSGLEPPSRNPTKVNEKLDSVAYDFKQSCVCGISFKRDNVHYFCDWLIRNGIMEPKLPGCYCCSAGRPVRAKELREHFLMKRFKRTFTPPAHNAFVYSEKNDTGHVHYGGREHAAVGTSVERDEYFEYYF